MMDYNRSEQAHLILSSFLQVTGKHLIEPDAEADSEADAEADLDQALFEAKFCVLSHNDDSDPIFNYGNRVALELFELNWEELISLPSRLSAEPQRREERQRLLKEVAEKGYIDNYQGVRVSSSGRRFMVKKSVVWNLINDAGQYRGQAAVLLDWQML